MFPLLSGISLDMELRRAEVEVGIYEQPPALCRFRNPHALPPSLCAFSFYRRRRYSVGGLICTVGGLILGPAFFAGLPRPGASIGSDDGAGGGADVLGITSCAAGAGGGGGGAASGAAPCSGITTTG
jgi:hypothetical protein